MQTVLDFFNARTSGEQVLLLFLAGVVALVGGIQVGKIAHTIARVFGG